MMSVSSAGMDNLDYDFMTMTMNHNEHDDHHDSINYDSYNMPYNNDEDQQDDYDYDYDDDTDSSWSSSYGGRVMMMHRYLAKEKSKYAEVRIDYSVFSVGVLTLGLILGVEMTRHMIDHYAAHSDRPFFKAVLDGVYAELATLGIVEFFLYVFMEYNEDYDKAKKEVFADVHFALFYTALLNAMQTAILAILTRRISNRIWVQTESLELDHYVEIREEFDIVQNQMNKLHGRQQQQQGGGNNHNAGSNGSSGSTDEDDRTAQNTQNNDRELPSNNNGNTTTTATTNAGNNNNSSSNVEDVAFRQMDTMGGLCGTIMDLIRFPALKQRYDHLLVQVRFHELRVFFLQAYHLPLKLHISDYLIRSEQEVLIHLVHVSTIAWLLLTGGMNILYYAIGIFVYMTEHASWIGYSMSIVFISLMGSFIMIAILVYFKMNTIFHEIMLTKNLWDITDNEDNNNTSDDENGNINNDSNNGGGGGVGIRRREILAQKQRELFWFGDPKLVIAAIQFMQFGYAVALSVVIIYWKDINEGSIHAGYYFLTVLAAYAIFLSIAVHVVPKYTLATSLGQLVNERILQATVAAFHLQEEKYRIQRIQMENEYGTGHKVGKTHHAGCIAKALPAPKATATTAISSSGASVGSTADSSSDAGASRASLMAEFVKLDTNSLRTVLPTTTTAADSSSSGRSSAEQLSLRQIERAARRRNRRRTVSDGVATMTSMSSPTTTTTTTATFALPPSSSSSSRAKTGPAGITSTTLDDGFLGVRKRAVVSSAAMSKATSTSVTKPTPTRGNSARGSAAAAAAAAIGGGTMGGSYNSIFGNDDNKAAAKDEESNTESNNNAPSSSVAATKNDLYTLACDLLITQGVQVGKKKKAIDPASAEKNKVSDTASVSSADGTNNSVVGGADDDHMILRPDDTKTERLLERGRTRTRRPRVRSVSDGVAFMAADIRSKVEAQQLEDEEKKAAKQKQQQQLQLGAIEEKTTTTPTKEVRIQQQPDHSGMVLDLSHNTESNTNEDDDDDDDAYDTRSDVDDVPEVHHSYHHSISGVSQHHGDDHQAIDHQDTAAAAAANGGAIGVEHDHNKSHHHHHHHDDHHHHHDPHHHHNEVSGSGGSSSLKQQLRDYYTSKQYVVISNVMGTLIVFFLVGQRIETFNHTETILSDEFVSFDFRHETTFWLIMVWLSMFIIKSTIALFVVLPAGMNLYNKADMKVAISATMDILLSCGCLVALVMGEIDRCCETGSADNYDADYPTARFLDEDTAYDSTKDGSYGSNTTSKDDGYSSTDDKYGGGTDDAYGYDTAYAKREPPTCGCPVFGSRLYGGYGNIEPYVALIALRMFRHRIAHRIIRHMRKRTNWSATAAAASSSSGGGGGDGGHHGGDGHDHAQSMGRYGVDLDPLNVHSGEGHHHHGGDDHHDDHGHGHGHGGGSINEMWEAAVAQHPDIVKEYGPFSGELLRAMLGVTVPQLANHSENQNEGSPSGTPLLEGEKNKRSEQDDAVNNPLSPQNEGATFMLNKSKYKKLSASAQEIIMAGEIGRTMKSSSRALPQSLKPGSDIIPEDSTLQHGIAKHATSLVFEIDTTQPNEVDSIFQSPNARLVRSMRRCDRRLLPILSKWSAVDVVMTCFEIVYFDAVRVDGPSTAEVEASREAIAATKGGKGLRLCDVAAGRRVVGHLQLSDIQTINVERELSAGEHEDINADRSDVPRTEYWTTSPHEKSAKKISASDSSDDAKQHLPRKEEWSLVKQDRLKIQTVNGLTLYLRYYSDLEHSQQEIASGIEGHDANDDGPLFKSNAFLWVQAIGRYCGPEQLKQPLPHIGEDTDDELRDYLVYRPHPHHQHKKDDGHHKRSLSPTRRPLSRAASMEDHRHFPTRPRRAGRATSDNVNSTIPMGDAHGDGSRSDHFRPQQQQYFHQHLTRSASTNTDNIKTSQP